MKAWKKVLVGAVAAATVGTGAIGAMAGASGDRPARVEVKDRSHEAEAEAGDVRREDRREDRHEAEARGREAEGEAPRGMDDREDIREAERGDDRGMDDRSGPSENAGPSDDSGHHGDED